MQQQPLIRALPVKTTRLHFRATTTQDAEAPQSKSRACQDSIAPNGYGLGPPISLSTQRRATPHTPRLGPPIMSRLQQSTKAKDRAGELPGLPTMRRTNLLHMRKAMRWLFESNMQKVHSGSGRRRGRMVLGLLLAAYQRMSILGLD
jgi:hypothetical protein